jgi:hypothetical protein
VEDGERVPGDDFKDRVLERALEYIQGELQNRGEAISRD